MIFRYKIWSWSLWAILCCSLISCNEDVNNDYELSDYSNALVTSFSLSDNSAVCPALSAYAFSIDQYGNSDPALADEWPGAGIIFNSDSLPYGAVPDSVKVNLTYTYPRAVLFYQYDSTGTVVDTVDFAKKTSVNLTDYAKTRLEVTAQDGVTKRSYFIKVNVHQVIGDTIAWTYCAEDLFDTSDLVDQRVEAVGRNLYWFTEKRDASQAVRTSSYDSRLTEWSAEQLLETPEALDLQTIYVWERTLYAVSQKGRLFASSDGLHWREASQGYDFVNLLGTTLKSKNSADSLRAVIRQDGEYRFAASADGTTWIAGASLPAGFPVEGYTRPISVPARPSAGVATSRLYIVGGRTADGTLVSSTWTCDGHRWAEFPQRLLPAMAGASIVRYTLNTDRPGTFWILFPGETGSGMDGELYFSENSGVTWKRLAPEYRSYADLANLAPVAFASALCDDAAYRLYLVGGKDESGMQRADVATGQLVKLTFRKRK